MFLLSVPHLYTADPPPSRPSQFLNAIKEHNFIVDASYGHICEFKDGLKSIDVSNNFKAEYKISPSKSKVVSKAKKISKE